MRQYETDYRLFGLFLVVFASPLVLLAVVAAVAEVPRMMAGKRPDPETVELCLCSGGIGVPGALSLAWLTQALMVMTGVRLRPRQPNPQAPDYDDNPPPAG